jgi:hypothetical protein
MPTLPAAITAFYGEFQTEVGMPASSALDCSCRRRHDVSAEITGCPASSAPATVSLM